MKGIKQLLIALVAGVAFQGLIFVVTRLHLSFAEYLMLPGVYALSPIFPQGVHSGNAAYFAFYLIVANTLCYGFFTYLLRLLISHRSASRNG